MTVREHLKKTHEVAAIFHSAMATAHTDAMKKEAMGGDHKEFHKAAADAHTTAAAAHGGMYQQCAKATDDELNKNIPSAVYSPVTAVPRAGQPALPARPNVPLQFAKLVAVDEDEENQLRS